MMEAISGHHWSAVVISTQRSMVEIQRHSTLSSLSSAPMLLSVKLNAAWYARTSSRAFQSGRVSLMAPV
jgi:hypothetical protein